MNYLSQYQSRRSCCSVFIYQKFNYDFVAEGGGVGGVGGVGGGGGSSKNRKFVLFGSGRPVSGARSSAESLSPSPGGGYHFVPIIKSAP